MSTKTPSISLRYVFNEIDPARMFPAWAAERLRQHSQGEDYVETVQTSRGKPRLDYLVTQQLANRILKGGV